MKRQKKLFSVILSLTMLCTMYTNAAATQHHKNVQELNEVQLKSSYYYLPDNNAVPNPKFKTSINQNTSSWWIDRIYDSFDNWYDTNTQVDISEDSSSRNQIQADSFPDTWYGLYEPYVYTSSKDFSKFIISINTDTLPKKSTFVQSTITHELGHALHLDDNPNTTSSSLMKHDRNRDKVYAPTSYDQDAVNYYYGYADRSINNEFQTDTKEEIAMLKADFPEYDSLDELKNAADIIVEVKVVPNSSKVDKFDSDKLNISIPYTITSVKAQNVIKGNISPNSIIDIKQLGNDIVHADDIEYLCEDNNYVLFLKEYSDSAYSLVNPVQGMYIIENDKIQPRAENTLNISLNDLN